MVRITKYIIQIDSQRNQLTDAASKQNLEEVELESSRNVEIEFGSETLVRIWTLFTYFSGIYRFSFLSSLVFRAAPNWREFQIRAL